MPVTATPVTTQVLNQDDIRGFLRDVAGQIPNTGSYNIMYDLPEFSDEEMRRAIKFTVARFNVMTPPSNDSQDSINIWLLLIGATEFLLTSEAHRQTRNRVTYGDGDVQPVGLDDKTELYLAMAKQCHDEFEDKAKNYKISRNLESCYGHLGSGYRNVSRFFHAS
jgi:hypothetical protein